MNEQSNGRSGRGRQQSWDPMGELQSLRAELSRLVGGGRSGPPEVELTENADGWEVVVRLPGVAPEEVAVELDDRELCVRARSEAEVNADHGIPGGFETRGFEYRVDLPARVDPDRIDAVMDHGLLRVRLPRAARPTPRTITVGRTGYRGTGGGAGRTGSPASADPAADRELHHPDTAVDEIDRP
ncbi:hsp20-like protein [Micromonospora sp. ATCC 39149]|uniref:Hsp20/alpha crystallin family protein n=1 Tax=Micromonospora carbonacea TaxID=47853 RepID=A0A7D5YDR1_9ACTN|nr:Hsp20/alpha crystallin family protein [Micromonospora sp. ATCC 39149]EEP72927.1 hsp20-like protein [Micromonospora sp. ATCC 39149]QLJ98993.1 Hsp20/alpha crystallin family protein [Micromonospora carbonacea]